MKVGAGIWGFSGLRVFDSRVEIHEHNRRLIEPEWSAQAASLPSQHLTKGRLINSLVKSMSYMR